MAEKFVPFERVVVVGLDGLSWETVESLTTDNSMASLPALMRKSNCGTLKATPHQNSTAAWTSILCGSSPGEHGILGPLRFDSAQAQLRGNDSHSAPLETVLERLSKYGVSTGSIFLPRTYPPLELFEGYTISGSDTPSVQSQFTYPADLREDVLSLSPELKMNLEDAWSNESGEPVLAQNIERAIASVDLLERLAIHQQRDAPARLQFVSLQAVSVVLRRLCREYLNSKGGGGDVKRGELFRKFFRRCDQMLNRVLGIHSSSSASQRFRPASQPGPRTLRIIVSSFGYGPQRGRISVNAFLQKWGLFKSIGALMRVSRRLFLMTQDASQARKPELEIEWSQTQAFQPFYGPCGYVYLNLRGREKSGIVPSGRYDEVRDSVMARFSAEKIPGSDELLFQSVERGEDIYAQKIELNLPDIVLVPAPGFELVSALNAVELSSGCGGVPQAGGIYLIEGPDVMVSPKHGGIAELADLAPTILAALGQPIPSSMTGRPMVEIFMPSPKVLRGN